MLKERSCGILLHISSLPSKEGIGDLGKAAEDFIDFLAASSQRYWQVLPINPVGEGNSPYSGLSAMAGNPLFISLDKLVDKGLLTKNDLKDMPTFPEDWVDYPRVKLIKNQLLQKAFAAFDLEDRNFREYQKVNAYWLEDYSLFMALKEYFPELAWQEWDIELIGRKKDDRAKWGEKLQVALNYHIFTQYIFEQQWQEIKNYAHKQRVKIIGDLPLFVSLASCDVWAHPEFFKLDKNFQPLTVAGVPPDYFSPTGQKWDNPHYNWQKIQEDAYLWWKSRLKRLLSLFDLIRIDHFRGLEASWEIPAEAKTAESGEWVKGPGEDFFHSLVDYFGQLPFIAEDLGYITADVRKLKAEFSFPGMEILQFILEEEDALARLKGVEENCVFYSGTHDNNTLMGWYNELSNKELIENIIANDLPWSLLELVYQSPAKLAIIPLQDILGLTSKARMNIPGTNLGNWQWRCATEILSKEHMKRLNDLATKYLRTTISF